MYFMRSVFPVTYFMSSVSPWLTSWEVFPQVIYIIQGISQVPNFMSGVSVVTYFMRSVSTWLTLWEVFPHDLLHEKCFPNWFTSQGVSQMTIFMRLRCFPMTYFMRGVFPWPCWEVFPHDLLHERCFPMTYFMRGVSPWLCEWYLFSDIVHSVPQPGSMPRWVNSGLTK